MAYWMRKKMLFNGIFFFGLHKAKKAVKAKKGQKIFFAKSLRIVQFGEKSNKKFFVGLAFKAIWRLGQKLFGLFDHEPFVVIRICIVRVTGQCCCMMKLCNNYYIISSCRLVKAYQNVWNVNKSTWWNCAIIIA